MGLLPESKLRKFLRSTAPWDLGGALAALAATGVGAGRLWYQNDGGFAIGTAIAGLVAFIFQCGKAFVTWRQTLKKDDLHELLGCLHTLETTLLGADVEPTKRQTAGLRITLHCPDGKDLVQCCEYVGDNRGRATKGTGRRLAQNTGVIGQAFREAKLPGPKPVLCGARKTADYDKFIEQMVKDYSFSKEEAITLSADTMSWAAYPIVGDRDKVYGVVYCDSRDPDFFTTERADRLLHAMVGVAYYVGLRYPE